MYKVFRAGSIIHVVFYSIEVGFGVPYLEYSFLEELFEGKRGNQGTSQPSIHREGWVAYILGYVKDGIALQGGKL